MRPLFILSILLLVSPERSDSLTAGECSTPSTQLVVPTPLSRDLSQAKGPFIASRGSQGYRGNRGKRGESGPRGCRGMVGEEGPPGKEGYHGIRGPAGFIGPRGAQGEPNYDIGPEGPQGPVGPQGPQGLQGPQGPSSICINHKKSFIWEEFVSGGEASGTIGALGWSLPVGTTLPPCVSVPTKNHPGIIRLSGGALLCLSPPPVGTIYISDPIDVRMIVRVNTDLPSSFGFFATGVESYLAFFAKHPPDEECYPGEEPPPRQPSTWHVQAARPDSCPVDCDTHIPVTNDWVSLRIFRPCANHSAFFYINNMFVYMIPAASVPEGPISFKIGSAGCCPDVSAIDVDYVSFRWPNLNR